MIDWKIWRRILEGVRSSDFVARYGGEEFAVALPDTDLAGGLLAGERFRSAVAASPVNVEGMLIGVTVSVGVAAFPAGKARTVNELLQVADERLYDAKRAGRDCVIPTPPLAPRLSSCVETPPPSGATREFQL